MGRSKRNTQRLQRMPAGSPQPPVQSLVSDETEQPAIIQISQKTSSSFPPDDEAWGDWGGASDEECDDDSPAAAGHGAGAEATTPGASGTPSATQTPGVAARWQDQPVPMTFKNAGFKGDQVGRPNSPKRASIETESGFASQLAKECVHLEEEATHWKQVSNEMKIEHAKFKDDCDQLRTQVDDLQLALQQEKYAAKSLEELYLEKERCVVKVTRERDQWEEDAISWKKISNDMKVERSKIKDMLQSQVACLEERILAKDRELLKKDGELSKLGEIAKEGGAQWFWAADDDRTYPFDMFANLHVEHAYQGGTGSMQLQAGIHTYDINFATMMQINVKSGKQRAIHRHPFQADDSDPVEVVKLAQLARVQCEGMHKLLADAREELRASKASQEILVRELEEAKGSAARHKQEIEILKADVKTMHEKDQGAKRQIDALQRDLKGAAQDAQQMRVQAQCRDREYQALLKQHSEVQQQVQDHVTLMQEVERDKDEQVRSVAEFWKADGLHGLAHCCLRESSSKSQEVTALFKQLSHRHPHDPVTLRPSKCYSFQSLQVSAVYSLHNFGLWRDYKSYQDKMRSQHKSKGIAVNRVDDSIHGLASMLEGLELETGLNEVLLATGCSEDAAMKILEEGFDVRLAGSRGGSMYGEGIYFSNQLCKCNQYTDPQGTNGWRHIIIARVALGDPCFLTQQYNGRRPEKRDDGKGCFDSHIVDPHLSQQGQSHWEFVIFDGHQAYPEVLVTYRIP